MRDVDITLNRSEAIVLFELLTAADETDRIEQLQDADRRVLWRVHGQLERLLSEPFEPDYPRRLAEARAAVLKDSHPTQRRDSLS
jgi:hypothetical protein